MSERSELDFEPLGSRVVIEPDAQADERQTEAGIVLFADSSQQSNTGVVMAFEAGTSYAGGRSVELGHRVVYSPFVGFRLVLGKKVYTIVDAGEILGLIPSGTTVEVG